MASVILGAVGTALGGPIGGMIGTFLGGMLDRAAMSALTPGTNTNTVSVGPRLTEMSLTGSNEGAVISRVVGRARIGGQVIWATQFKEVAETTTTSQSQGGKGGGPTQTQNATTTVYKYYLSFAVAFCEGNPHTQLGRVWIDSQETDLSKFTFRWYPGSQTQSPDALIQAKEGIDSTPAFRGTAYIVFEDLPLEQFGNRMPQVTAEIVCPLDTADPDDIATLAKSWQLIPASGEVAYATQAYKDTNAGSGGAKTQNLNNNFRQPDAVLAIDQLNQFSNNLEAVSLVISWFGTDLRAGICNLEPRHEDPQRALSPSDWAVAGYTRGTANRVSVDAQGRPIFGGTPSDATVLECVTYLRNLGKRVMFYPFILMDIQSGNTLNNPYSANAASVGQPVIPWRGRITCSPAPGFTGTVDKTATAQTQLDVFIPKYRAMILHYANLLAGQGLDSFIIGSELVGLTSIRSSASNFPFVNALVALAADVSAILGPTVKVSYAADWSEYHSYRPADGTNDVYFNLDPLWSSSDIDFVGIDNYLPISDWRDGSTHLDYNAVTGPVSEYDPAYLKSQIEGGEGFAYFYASPSARAAQVRTPITDGLGKPWVFRQKDIRSWWSNTHRNRPGGIESGVNTSWVAQSKPIWFTEFGCPAVNKGTNQPNTFYDPKSSETFFPYFSNGMRDDLIQRLYLEVTLQYWRDNAPTSLVYGDKMLKPANMFIWTWDARPFPAYPAQSDIWADGPLWPQGHCVSGRMDSAMLPRLVANICERVGLNSTQYDVSGLYGPGGLVRGLYIGNSTSEREILETLARFHQFNGFESEGKLKFTMHINTKTVNVPRDKIVISEDRKYPVSITRKQEVDLPRSAKITYLDEVNGFLPATVDGQKATGSAQNVISYNFPFIASDSYVRGLATTMIHQAWRARETGDVILPPSYALLEQGDGMLLPVSQTRTVSVRIDQLDITDRRAVEFSGFDTTLFAPPVIMADSRLPVVQSIFQAAILEFMDIPLISGEEENPHAMRLATYARPWPGSINVLKSDGAGDYVLIQQLGSRATMGVLNSQLFSGPVDRWDNSNTFDVQVLQGELASLSREQLLASNGNAMAIRNAATDKWEVLQFATASLLAPGSYRLSGLIRGVLDTKDAMVGGPYPVGSRFVILEPGAVRALNVSAEQAGLPIEYRWGASVYPSNDPTYLTAIKAGTKRGLRPYTPTDERLRRSSATGNLLLTWKRCTRHGGDGWEQVEVALNEEAEQYALTVLTGPAGTVKRSVVTTSPSWTYTAADQIIDFGSTQTQVYVQIAQYGQAYGNIGGVFEGYVYMGSST